MTVPDRAAMHARISERALALPEVSEHVSHGSPAWKVADKKMFAYYWHDHHGDGITALLVKTSGVEEQAMLIDLDPDIYYRPPYLGPSGWVGVRLDGDDLDWDLVDHRLRESWRLAAPRRLSAMLDF